MTRIWMTGFEAGSADVMVASEGATALVTDPVRTGGYALYINERRSWRNRVIPERPQEFYLRMGYRFVKTIFYSTGTFLRFLDPTGEVHLNFNYEGGAITVRNRYGDTSVASGGVLLPDTWTCLEIYCLLAPDATGRLVVKQDGETIIDFTGATRGESSTLSQLGSVSLGGSSQATAYIACEGYYDDLALNDTTGERNNSWIGRGGIYLNAVDAAGVHAEWTPSAGDNYACVDEVPPSDADYVESDTLGQRDLYALGGIAPTDGLVSAVQWVGRARLTDGGLGGIQPLLRQDGVDYAYDSLPVDTSFVYRTHILEEAPDGTDWTVAKVNALQAGAQIG